MSYSQQVFDQLSQRYSYQPEFSTGVEEVLGTFSASFLDKDPAYQNKKILKRITEPERVIHFLVQWVDDKGEIQVNRGYRVQFNSAIGPYKGGLRLHPSVNEGVLKFLGFEQISKKLNWHSNWRR